MLPLVCICPRDAMYEKMISNIEEVRARSNRIISVGDFGDDNLQNVSDIVFPVHRTQDELFTAFALNFTVAKDAGPTSCCPWSQLRRRSAAQRQNQSPSDSIISRCVEYGSIPVGTFSAIYQMALSGAQELPTAGYSATLWCRAMGESIVVVPSK